MSVGSSNTMVSRLYCGRVLQGALFLTVSTVAQGIATPYRYHPYSNLSSTEILRAPENETTFLSQSGSFTCETRGGTTSWRVNGTQSELLSLELPSGDLYISKNTTPDGHSLETSFVLRPSLCTQYCVFMTFEP